MYYIDSLHEKNYKDISILRTSNKGYVMKAAHVSGVKVILKSFKRKHVKSYQYDEIFSKKVHLELFYLIRLNKFPFVPAFFNYCDGTHWTTIVMELLENDWIVGSNFFGHRPEESTTKIIFRNIINYVYEMAKFGFYHLDLKPSNMMINRKTLDVKFIDFEDMLYDTLPNPGTFSHAGTISYKSPESCEGHIYKVKPSLVFNMGCILYTCLEWRMAFTSKVDTIVCKPIKTYKSSCNAKSFIKNCTYRDINRRIKFHEMLDHPWFF